MDINVLISNPDYFSNLLDYKEITGIYVEQERLSPDRISRLVSLAHSKGKKLYVALPHVWNMEVEKTLNREISAIMGAFPDGYLVRNLDELGLLSDRNARGTMIMDASMYTWNKASMYELARAGANIFTAPYELNRKELIARGFADTEVVIYGYYPMMVSNNCLKQTTGRCVKEKNPYGIYHLKDHTGTVFTAVNQCKYCYNVIYNNVPTWLLDEKEVYAGCSVRLSFTIESELEMKNILANYFSGNAEVSGKFTRGHYKRGAE